MLGKLKSGSLCFYQLWSIVMRKMQTRKQDQFSFSKEMLGLMSFQCRAVLNSVNILEGSNNFKGVYARTKILCAKAKGKINMNMVHYKNEKQSLRDHDMLSSKSLVPYRLGSWSNLSHTRFHLWHLVKLFETDQLKGSKLSWWCVKF